MKKTAGAIVSVLILLATTTAAAAQQESREKPQASPPAKTEKKVQSKFSDRPKPREGSKVAQDEKEKGKEKEKEKLDAAEVADLQKYSDDLTSAGLSPADVKDLVRQETAERTAAKKRVSTPKGPHAPAPRPAAKPDDEPMGSFVKALLARGMRGQALADAIHAEQARRKAANGHGSKPEKATGSKPTPPPSKGWGHKPAPKKKAKPAAKSGGRPAGD